MAQSFAASRRIEVFAAPDSGLTPGKFFVKLGSEEGPIIQCSVLVSTSLSGIDSETDQRGISIIQDFARGMGCFSPDLTVTGIRDKGYPCGCGHHLIHRGNTPLAVYQILQLPEGVLFEHAT